ncbi:jg17207 [Pararge aegeria aegeria]|uniref:Jg17207 protein n=1 Tax=Pararge aegeria aegeria TaxID=348720 RepID=A0A8S4SFM1_9NEOP|nr:jg17207 [Pararge aegeria aegeria]
MTVARGDGSPERLGGALRRLHYRATRRAHSAAARHHSGTPKPVDEIYAAKPCVSNDTVMRVELRKPRHCSASAMLVSARVDYFKAIMQTYCFYNKQDYGISTLLGMLDGLPCRCFGT